MQYKAIQYSTMHSYIGMQDNMLRYNKMRYHMQQNITQHYIAITDNTLQYSKMSYYIKLHYTTLHCNAIQHNSVIHYNARKRIAVPYNGTLYETIHYTKLHCNTIQRNTELHCKTTHHSTMKCDTI